MDLDQGFEVFAKMVMDAVTSGNWGLVAALAVVGLVWALRKFGGEKWPFLKTDAGGAVLVLLMGASGAVATALAGGSPITWAILLAGLKVGFTAAGGFATVKKLLPWVMGKLGFKTAEKVKEAAKAEGEKAAAEADVGLSTMTEVKSVGTFGKPPTAEELAAFERMMSESGYHKVDGKWTKK